MSQRSFFSKIAVSRIVNNSNSSRPRKFDTTKFKPSNNPTATDNYGICIKAKAIAKSSGASQALSFSLNQLDKPSNTLKSSRPVLFNTVLSALGAEGKAEKFWEVVEARVVGNDELWSPQLAATLLNQIAKEMQRVEQQDEEARSVLMQKATQIYIKALEILRVPEHLHLHNAFLKCLSRNQNVPFLLWILNLLTKNRFNLDLRVLGVKEYLPVSDSSLKLVSLIGAFRKAVDLDVQSLTSILGTLSRSPDGSIQLAEAIWSNFQTSNLPLDQSCHLALLVVYRNDLSRIFKHQKLIRSQSWRQRKLSRVMEIIDGAGVDLAADPKFLSIYFEICMNARLTEKVDEFLQLNPLKNGVKDERLLEVIKRSKRA